VKNRLRFQLIVALAAALGLLALVSLLPLQDWAGDGLTWLAGAGSAGWVVFLGIYTIAAVLLVPGSFLTMAAGAVFGVVHGIAIGLAGAMLGSTAAFLLARLYLRSHVASWAESSPTLSALDAALGREGGRIVLLARLSPLLPYNLLNYLFGITRVRFATYLAASLVGMLPGTAFYAYFGSAGRAAVEASSGPPATGTGEFAFWALGLVAAALLGLILARMVRRSFPVSTS
jgi:uncharacterized membrane protein YdjX (TVP38/TMEM64 family)